MEKFQLQLLFKIIGLGSASGLLYHNNVLLALGDNASYLYEYHLENKELKKHPLIENALENTPKNIKCDFEAITQFGNDIYIFGSGSTEKRNTMVKIDASTKKKVNQIDLTNLYETMQSFGEIKPEDFNIEGVIYNGINWYFFNRSNGKKSKNCVFTISGTNLTDDFSVLFNSYNLPKIKGVETTFTDAILVDDQIYFLATAEDVASTYDDGAVLGSIIGTIDLESMKLKATQKITAIAKLEGLALYEQSNEALTFLICEDNDSDVQESTIYKLIIKR